MTFTFSLLCSILRLALSLSEIWQVVLDIEKFIIFLYLSLLRILLWQSHYLAFHGITDLSTYWDIQVWRYVGSCHILLFWLQYFFLVDFNFFKIIWLFLSLAPLLNSSCYFWSKNFSSFFRIIMLVWATHRMISLSKACRKKRDKKDKIEMKIMGDRLFCKSMFSQ